MTRVTIEIGGKTKKNQLSLVLWVNFWCGFSLLFWFRNPAQSLHHDSLLSRNFKPFTEHYKAWAHSLHFALSPTLHGCYIPFLIFLGSPTLCFSLRRFHSFFSSAVALYHFFIFSLPLIKNVKSERVNSISLALAACYASLKRRQARESSYM